MDKRKSKIDTGLSNKLQDPRALKDKDFQSKSLKSLIKYLIKHNYPNPVSLSLCLSGDMEIFKEISDFLLKQLDPSLSFSTEKELQDLLKAINYPYPIHSQYFSGASNYWPYLIGIMDWLLKTVNSIESDPQGDIYSQYFLQAYGKFMKDEPYNELRCKFETKLEEYCEGLEKNIEDSWKEIKEMRKKKKEMKINPVPQVDEKIVKIQEEIEEEMKVNEGILNELRLFEANFEDFNREVLAVMPGGIPTVEQVEEIIENDKRCNREIHRMMIEIDEFKAMNPEKVEMLVESELNVGEGEEIQEEIDDCRRECSYMMEEIELVEENINRTRNEIENLMSTYKLLEVQSESALRQELNTLFDHTLRIKSLFSDS